MMASPGHLWCNGQAKCFNLTLDSMITSYVNGRQRELDKFLGFLVGLY